MLISFFLLKRLNQRIIWVLFCKTFSFGQVVLPIEKSLPEAKDRVQMVRDVLKALGQPIQTPFRKVMA